MRQLQVCLATAVIAVVVGLPHGDPLRDNDGAQVLRIDVTTHETLQYVAWLQVNTALDFWTEPRMGNVDIMARSGDVSTLKRSLHRRSVPYEVLVPDVSALVTQATSLHEEARAVSTGMDWTSYHDYDEIMAWLDQLAESYPHLATVTTVGTTFEGRAMKLLKLSTGGEGKDAIFTDGAIHAREWISPATVTYFINELVSGRDDGILDHVDLYFMPVINPDGYAFTFAQDRMWRKTRSVTPGNACIGADPNRNWSFHWMEIGASSSPCSDVFAGAVPFSEVEMQVVRDVLLEVKPRVYLTFHSYSQLFMYPWGFTSDLPDNWRDLDSLARSSVDALTAVYGTQYDIGSSTNTIYPAAGGSDDWAMGVGGSEYAYTIELRDTGNYGFLLPPELILETGIETYEAFKVVGKFIADNPSRKL